MARENFNGGAVLRCDQPGCPARFVTYSVSSKARQQAADQGWSRISGKKSKDKDGHILSTKQVDLCPDCKPKPQLMGQGSVGSVAT